MALGETARLIASLELDARKFQKSLKAADASLSKTEGRAFHAGQQIGTGIKNGLKIAAAGVGFIAANVALGVDSLIELEKQTAQTNAVIKSTGGAAKISAEEVGRLADKYEALNATIGDEVIRSAENMLLTFTNVKDKAFEPALKAILDLNTAMGKGPEGLTKTTIQVGKALNDPIKGITALSKVGVHFTAQQKDQIAKLLSLTKGEEKHYLALRKSNKAAAERYKASRIASRQDDAQRIILKELNKEFGGSFLAQGNTTAGKVAKFTDAIDDLQRALAEALLPAIGDIADALSELLRDPATQSGIRDLGKDIAGIFSKGNIKAAAKIIGDVIAGIRDAAPTIKSGLGAAADLIGKVVDAFQKLPPDVQKLAIGALAVNKLTGGLITNLAGALLGGALKTITAGNVTVIGANVTGGGVPGGTPGAAGKGVGDLVKAAPAAIGLTGAASLTIAAIAPLALGELALAIAQAATGKTTQQLDNESRLKTAVARGVDEKLVPAVRDHLPGEFGKPLDALLEDSRRRTQDQGRDADRAEQLLSRQIKAAEDIRRQESRSAQEDQRRGERIVATGQQTKAAIDASKARLAAVMTETQRETNRGIAATGAATAAAARAAGERARAASLATAEAVRRQKLRTNVTVVNRLNLSIRDTQRKLSFSQNMAIYG